jgi:diacylglycerol O-acyltransferase
MERLTGLDAGFLYLETPTSPMHTLKVALLDPAPGSGELDAVALRDRVAARLHLLPPLRRRVVEVPFGLHHPVWIEDPDLDLDHHIRVVRVDAPGGAAEMDAKISEIARRPLDRGRPLWELTLLDGMADGRLAVLVKVHHAVADGVAASQLLANVMVTDPADDPHVPDDHRVRGSADWRPDPRPGRGRLVVDALRDHVGGLRELPGLVVATTGRLAALAAHRRAAEIAAPRPMLDVPRTSFNRSLTPARSFATTSLPLDEVRRVKQAAGVTLNDVVLAVVSGALCRYLDAGGELPDRSLVAGVPLSADAPSDQLRLGGNRVSNLFTTLATDEEDLGRRLQRIHDVTAEAKQVADLLGPELLASWSHYVPPRPYAWIVRQYARFDVADRLPPPLNVIVSNVPGPREELFAGGARLVELYSVGPVLEGIGLNITVWSYLDRLFVGVLACADAVPDASAISAELPIALEALAAALAVGATSTA